MQVKGIYRHFKGNKYEALGLAKERESDEIYVLYRKLYGDMGYWLRPYEMFFSEKETENGTVKRFTKIHESESNIEFDDELFYISATHSETEKEYEIIGVENSDDGKIFIVKKEDDRQN